MNLPTMAFGLKFHVFFCSLSSGLKHYEIICWTKFVILVYFVSLNYESIDRFVQVCMTGYCRVQQKAFKSEDYEREQIFIDILIYIYIP